MITWIGCILGAYAVGSVPFGVLIGRARGIDIRQHGSKNIGATNVGRVLGRKLGGLCFVLDLLKGAAPVAGAGLLTGVLGRHPNELSAGQMWLWMAVAGAAVIGHMFSIFLGLRGGKGVATGFGALLAMWPLLTWAALASMTVWIITVRIGRYISVASMLAVLSLPLSYAAYLLAVMPAALPAQGSSGSLDYFVHGCPPFIGTGAMALLVIYQHRANIGRLRRGEEPKVGGKRDGTRQQ